MKKGFVLPAAVLTAVLAFCLWNGAAMAGHAARWQGQLAHAERLAGAGDWAGAAAAVEASYADWTKRQTWLRCVASHDAADSAEAMYRRSLAFAQSREDSEFRAEIADLRAQLRLLAKMEEFSLSNVL